MANSNNYDYPTDTPMVDLAQFITVPWGQWVNRTHAAAMSVQQSGPTSDRPTQRLWIGRFFYDTTLNQPIWVSGVKPTVWRNANGVAV